jgi:sugar-specific transcriptional regulator TrmB
LIVSDQKIQILQRLGLTLNQAKVYFALVNLNVATAKSLSDISGLAACDVYRVIPELQKRGLVEILVVSPKEFKATPPEEAIKILSKRKEEEAEEIQTKAREFLVGISQETCSQYPEDARMLLIPCGERTKQFGKPKLLATQRRLDCIQTNMVFRRFINDTAEDLVGLLRKKVEVRFVIENAEGLERPDEDLTSLLKNCNFKVKFAQTSIPACILLHDDTDAFISTSLDTVHTPSYWSNNPCVIAVVRRYFETMWQEASENEKGDLPL